MAAAGADRVRRRSTPGCCASTATTSAPRTRCWRGRAPARGRVGAARAAPGARRRRRRPGAARPASRARHPAARRGARRDGRRRGRRGGRRGARPGGGPARRARPAADAARRRRAARAAARARRLPRDAGELQRVRTCSSPELDGPARRALRARAWIALPEGAGARTLDDIERHLEPRSPRPAATPRYAPSSWPGAPAHRRLRRRRPRRGRGAGAEALHAGGRRRERAAGARRAGLGRVALRGRPVDELCARFRAGLGRRLVPRRAARAHRRATARLARRAGVGGAGADDVCSRVPTSRASRCPTRCSGSTSASCTSAPATGTRPGRGSPSGPSRPRQSCWSSRCTSAAARSSPRGRGAPAEAEAWAARAISAAAEVGVGWDRLEALRARGLARCSRASPPRRPTPSGRLGRTRGPRHRRAGCLPGRPGPGRGAGRAGGAGRGARGVERPESARDAPGPPVGARDRPPRGGRCRARGRRGRRAAALAAAADALGALGLPLDQARALLALGRAQRRRKQWRAAARGAGRGGGGVRAGSGRRLGHAGPGRGGAAGAAPRRRPTTSSPRPSERVARAGLDGLSNKEIAAGAGGLGAHRRDAPLELLREARHPLADPARRRERLGVSGIAGKAPLTYRRAMSTSPGT